MEEGDARRASASPQGSPSGRWTDGNRKPERGDAIDVLARHVSAVGQQSPIGLACNEVGALRAGAVAPMVRWASAGADREVGDEEGTVTRSDRDGGVSTVDLPLDGRPRDLVRARRRIRGRLRAVAPATGSRSWIDLQRAVSIDEGRVGSRGAEATPAQGSAQVDLDLARRELAALWRPRLLHADLGPEEITDRRDPPDGSFLATFARRLQVGQHDDRTRAVGVTSIEPRARRVLGRLAGARCRLTGGFGTATNGEEQRAQTDEQRRRAQPPVPDPISSASWAKEAMHDQAVRARGRRGRTPARARACDAAPSPPSDRRRGAHVGTARR
jgi:hypothetical protein